MLHFTEVSRTHSSQVWACTCCDWLQQRLSWWTSILTVEWWSTISPISASATYTCTYCQVGYAGQSSWLPLWCLRRVQSKNWNIHSFDFQFIWWHRSKARRRLDRPSALLMQSTIRWIHLERSQIWFEHPVIEQSWSTINVPQTNLKSRILLNPWLTFMPLTDLSWRQRPTNPSSKPYVKATLLTSEIISHILRTIFKGKVKGRSYCCTALQVLERRSQLVEMFHHQASLISLTRSTESVAEYTRRPLLSITAADLGHDPVELEKNLLTFFRNANNWRAIVLLDEADIYLERRSTNDLRRNSIVSSMLYSHKPTHCRRPWPITLSYSHSSCSWLFQRHLVLNNQPSWRIWRSIHVSHPCADRIWPSWRTCAPRNLEQSFSEAEREPRAWRARDSIWLGC